MRQFIEFGARWPESSVQVLKQRFESRVVDSEVPHRLTGASKWSN
jgi:hypothetical protein